MKGGLSILLLLVAWPATAQTVRVVDGDTIKLDGTSWGIDAPETKQTCADGWRAGIEATAYMRELVSGHTVECDR